MTLWRFGVINKVKPTTKVTVTFLGHKLGQTDHKGHHDLSGHKVGHGDLYWPRDVLGL